MSGCICSYAMRLHCILNIEVYPVAWRPAAHSRGVEAKVLWLSLPLSRWNASCTPASCSCHLPAPHLRTTSRLQDL
jgi:hypothetical protein